MTSKSVDKLTDFLVLKVAGLPMILTERSESKYVRGVGFFLGIPWLCVSMVLMVFPLVVMSLIGEFLIVMEKPADREHRIVSK